MRYAPHSASKLDNLSKQGTLKTTFISLLLTSKLNTIVLSDLGILSYNFSRAFLIGRCSSEEKFFTSFIASSSNIFRSSLPMHSVQPTLLVPYDERRGDFLQARLLLLLLLLFVKVSSA